MRGFYFTANNAMNFESVVRTIRISVDYLKHNRNLTLAIGAGLLAAVLLMVYVVLTTPRFNWQSTVYHPSLTAPRLLDGRLVHRQRANLKPVAMVIENHAEARPLAGLDQASIVYEIVVEGDITRFLAIFDGDFSVKKIGPVRSIRPFFIDLAEEWGAVLLHSGGSPDGLTQVKTSSVFDINEISSDGIYFWRDANRTPPHNLYTSSALVNRALIAKKVRSEEHTSELQSQR